MKNWESISFGELYGTYLTKDVRTNHTVFHALQNKTKHSKLNLCKTGESFISKIVRLPVNYATKI